MVKFNNEEVRELRIIVQEWLSEGFVSKLNNVQKDIVDKLENESLKVRTDKEVNR